MYGLDLFSGIGGISRALEPWVRTVAYCERDTYCQAVLLSRMSEGAIDRAPIWDDVTTLSASMLPRIDIIFGGFPCQDISVAGAGKGLAGERSGLFYQIVRLTKEIRPSFVFLENVPAIRTRGLEEVIKAFTQIGYDCRWACISAESVGAPHKRERWFLLAHANGNNLRKQSNGESELKGQAKLGNDGEKESMAYSDSFWKLPEQETRQFSLDRVSDSSENVSDSNRERPQRQRKKSERAEEKQPNPFDDSWWETEPAVGRVVNGLLYRAHRIKSLGNSVVPLQAQTAFKILIGESK